MDCKLYGADSLNQYAHCPKLPGDKLVQRPLNCNIDYNVDKEYDNYVMKGGEHRMVEKFGGGWLDFLVKIIIFFALIYLILYFLKR